MSIFLLLSSGAACFCFLLNLFLLHWGIHILVYYIFVLLYLSKSNATVSRRGNGDFLFGKSLVFYYLEPLKQCHDSG